MKESGGVCGLCTTSKQQEATAALSWKDLRTGTALLSFSTSFFTSQTGYCPTFLKYLCTLGLTNVLSRLSYYLPALSFEWMGTEGLYFMLER